MHLDFWRFAVCVLAGVAAIAASEGCRLAFIKTGVIPTSWIWLWSYLRPYLGWGVFTAAAVTFFYDKAVSQGLVAPSPDLFEFYCVAGLGFTLGINTRHGLKHVQSLPETQVQRDSA
jgi:hypothetical protein